MSRADKRTWRDAEEEIYSDFDISFEKNPITGSLIRVTNDDAIKQSLRNIILASRGEWAFHPTLGSKVYHLLFEPLDAITASMIKTVIVAALKHEPRITLGDVIVKTNESSDGYDLTIWFTTNNTTEPVEFKEFLSRVR